jgi:cytosine permease
VTNHTWQDGPDDEVRPDTAAANDDYPQCEVPPAARRGFWPLFVVLAGFVIFTPTMLSGARIAGAFPAGELLSVLAVGSVVLGLYVAILAAIGARTGLTTVLLARFSLGHRGAKLAGLLLGGTQVCWYAVTTVLLADLAMRATGLDPALTPLVVVAGSALTAVAAYYGFRGLELLSAVSVPLVLALFAWVTVQAVEVAGGPGGLWSWDPPGAETISWATAVTIVVGTFVSGGTQTPNWSRFARRPRQAFVAAFAAFLLCNAMMLLLGALGAVAYRTGDVIAVVLQLDLAFGALAILFLKTWTTQENTAYAFGVAGAELFGRPRKRPFVIGGVAVAIVLALTGIYESLPQFLVALGILIPPLGGTIIGDHLFVWRGKLPAVADTTFLPVRWSCVAAYAVGVATAFVTEQLSWGLPPVQGILAAALAVPVAERLLTSAGVDTRHATV